MKSISKSDDSARRVPLCHHYKPDPNETPEEAHKRANLTLYTFLSPDQVERLGYAVAKRTRNGWEVPEWFTYLEMAAATGQTQFYCPVRVWNPGDPV